MPGEMLACSVCRSQRLFRYGGSLCCWSDVHLLLMCDGRRSRDGSLASCGLLAGLYV